MLFACITLTNDLLFLRASGMNWGNSMETYTLSYVKQIAVGICCVTGAQPSALWQPRGEVEGRWKGIQKGGTHVYLWLIHVDVRQNPRQYWKQLSSNKKRKKLELYKLYICTFSAIAISYVIKKLAKCYKMKQIYYAILLLFLKTFWVGYKGVPSFHLSMC